MAVRPPSAVWLGGRSAGRGLRAAALGVALALGAALLGGPADAGPHTEVADGGAPLPAADAGLLDAGSDGAAADAERLDALRARAALLRRQRDAVRTLVAGSLPDELYTTELFRVPLLDEPAVERRRAELDREIAARRARAKRLSAGKRLDGGAPRDAGPPEAEDAGTAVDGREAIEQSIAELELELAEARLSFLQKPREERAAVRDAEAEHRRLAGEQEAAAAAQKRAEEQARAAEDGRRRALAAAEAAREAGERALANERAAAEGVRAQQAALRRDLAERRSALTTAQRDDARTLFELTQLAQDAATGSEAADALYDRIVAEVTRARGALREALDSPPAARPAPRYVPGTVPPEGRAELSALATELSSSANELDAEGRALAWEITDAAAARVAALNAQRLALLPRLSAGKHDAVLGVGADGRDQLRREVQHLGLMGRWAWAARRRTLASAVAALSRPLFVGGLVARLAGLFALIAAARFVRRRGDGWLGTARALTARHVHRRILSMPIQSVLNALGAVLPDGVFLVAVMGAGAVVGASFHGAMLAAAYESILAYAAYRLASTAAHRTITRVASTPLARITEGRSDKILRSVRLAGRYVFAVSVFLVVSEALLGRGYLYHVAARFAWLGGVPIAAVLIRAWQDDISDAYLASHGKGSLADAVRSTRSRWYGFFVAVLAFLAVLLSFAARSARRFILGFEQSRKALAYLFRRRLERRAVEQSVAAEVVALPDEVTEKLAPDPIDGEPFAIDRYPEMARFDRAFAGWSEGRAGAVLVVGKTGYGKTSWLNAAASRVAAAPVVRVDLDARLRDEAGLVERLRGPLGAPEAEDVAALAAAIQRGPRRLVIIDDAQNLFQRGVGTLDAFVALDALITSAGERVFWLCAMAHHPHEYLAWARRGTAAFREVIQIPAWTEREIADLLLARTQATGWEPVYEDLLVDDVEGVAAESQLVSTAQDYLRLIWDYAEGSPRVALHCWAGSLVPDGAKQLRVRLFRRPEEDVLDRLTDEQRFVLAGVIWHESITTDEAVRALRYPRLACEEALHNLRDLGVLRADGDRYRVAIAWWPAVRRYLRRKHLIET